MFVNRFLGTDEMLKEYINKVLCRKLRRKAIVGIILAVAMFIININSGDVMFAGFMGALALILILTAIMHPIMMFREIKKLDNNMHRGAKPDTIVTFDDKITMTEGEVSMTFAYSQITELHKLNLSWTLMMGKNNAIMIEPNSFEGKSVEEFEKFIYEKCSNMKRKQHQGK